MALTFFDKGVKDRIFDRACIEKFDPIWGFDSVEMKLKYIAILGVQHEYKAINEAPNPQAGLEVMRQYSRAAFVAKRVANGCLVRVGMPNH